MTLLNHFLFSSSHSSHNSVEGGNLSQNGMLIFNFRRCCLLVFDLVCLGQYLPPLAGTCICLSWQMLDLLAECWSDRGLSCVLQVSVCLFLICFALGSTTYPCLLLLLLAFSVASRPGMSMLVGIWLVLVFATLGKYLGSRCFICLSWQMLEFSCRVLVWPWSVVRASGECSPVSDMFRAWFRNLPLLVAVVSCVSYFYRPGMLMFVGI